MTSTIHDNALLEYLSPAAAARRVGLSKWSIYRACASGALVASKPTGPNGPWVIATNALAAWIAAGEPNRLPAGTNHRPPARSLARQQNDARQRLAQLRAGKNSDA